MTTDGKYTVGAEGNALGLSHDNRRRGMPTHDEDFDPGDMLSGGNETAGPIAAHLQTLDSHIATLADETAEPLAAHLQTLDSHIATLASLLGSLPPGTPVWMDAHGAGIGERPAEADDQAGR